MPSQVKHTKIKIYLQQQESFRVITTAIILKLPELNLVHLLIANSLYP